MRTILLITSLIWWIAGIIYWFGVKLPLWLRIIVWLLSIVLWVYLILIPRWVISWMAAITLGLTCLWATTIWNGGKIILSFLTVIWIILLFVEFYNQYNTLQDFTSKVSVEAKNRKDILNKYTERDNNMSRIILLEKDIISYVKKMLNTDCVNNDKCDDANQWNSLSNQLDNAFEEKDDVRNKSRVAISSENQVELGKSLWLLDLFWMNNSKELSESLNKYSDSISKKKESINSKINQIEDLEADCNYPPIMKCTRLKIDLEKEH